MSSDDRFNARLRSALVVAGLLPLAVFATWLSVDSLRLATNMPAQLNYVDGFSADDALRLARGEPLYPDPSAAPYTVTVYTPGYFAVVAALVRVVGADAVAAGRLVVLLSMLAAAGVICWSGFQRTGWVAVLAGLALLLQPLQWPWSLVIRPDFTAILLSVVAVVLAGGRRGRPATVLPALLCVAAVFTKQTAIAAPAAIAAGLLVRDRQAAARFAAIFVSAILVGAVALQQLTGGQFLFHTITANANPYHLDRALSFYGRFIAANPMAIAALVIMLAAAAGSRRLSIPGGYALCSLVTALAAGKIGSSMNYFLEPLVALALWTAHDFPTAWFAHRGAVRSAIASLGVAAVVIVSATSSIDQLRSHDLARSALPLHAELVRTVAAVPGPVVSDDATLLVGAGKRVHFRPFIMTQLAEAGLWDQSPFLTELDQGTVAMVIYRSEPRPLHESRYTLEMRAVMAARYRPAFNYRLGSPFVALTPIAVGAPEAPIGAGGE